MHNEIWRAVLGYEGSYEVSNLGRVRSLIAKTPQRLLSIYLRRDGYQQVQLKVNQRPCNRLVHTLVDEAFRGAREPGKEVNHVDGNKQHNLTSNLERVTRRQNVRHAFASGLCGTRIGAANSQARLTEVQVLGLRVEYRAAKEGRQRVAKGTLQRLANQCGVSLSAVRDAITGASWSHL